MTGALEDYGTARQAAVTAVLEMLTAEAQLAEPGSDVTAVLGDDREIDVAARVLAEATGALPWDRRPAGWSEPPAVSGVPLTRTAPIAPGQPPARKTGLARVAWARTVPGVTTATPPAKKAATRRASSPTGNLLPDPPAEFSPKVKRLVRERAGRGDIFEADCEGCGIRLGEENGQVHHRAGRGSGGCRDKVANSCANALLLCGDPFTGCHGAATAFELHLRDDAAGFWIRHGTTPEFDPRNVAVMLHALGAGGMTLWLAEDGIGPDKDGYLRQRPELELIS